LELASKIDVREGFRNPNSKRREKRASNKGICIDDSSTDYCAPRAHKKEANSPWEGRSIVGGNALDTGRNP